MQEWTLRIRALLFSVLLVSIAGAARAQEAGDNITVSGQRADTQLLAGETVLVTADVADDVFAAGARVTLRGARADHAVLAGEDVTLADTDVKDAVLAGQDVSIDARIADDLVAAGENVHLAATLALGDDAWLAGRTVEIAGKIGGNLRAAGRRIVIRGDIAGNVDLAGDQIELAPGARIGGDLRYRSRAEIVRAADATVAGNIIHLASRPERNIGRALGVFFGFTMFSFAVLVLIVQGLLPTPIIGAGRRIAERTGISFLAGAAFFFLIPMLAIALMITVIGLPAGFLVLTLYGVALALAMVAAAWWIGSLIGERVNRSETAPGYGQRILWTLVGVLVLAIVSLVPFLGGLLVFVAFLIGLGGLALHFWRLRSVPTGAV